MSHQLLFRSVLSILLIFGSSHLKVWSSSHLGIHSLDDLPGQLNDTTSYTFSLFIVNHDPVHPWVNPINILLSVNEDEQTVLLDAFVPAVPVFPGDSLQVTIHNYEFESTRFLASGGGGITHDIIVWPSFLGASSIDSAKKSVIFHHTQSSNHLKASAPSGFPAIIGGNQSYHLTFEVENKDMGNYLLDPVTLYMSVDGDSPSVLVQNVYAPQPLPPGNSFGIDISNYTFNPARFSGGGGITHDIIVWPMTLSLEVIDSFRTSARFLPQSQPTIPDLNIEINPDNFRKFSRVLVFPNPSHDHVRFSMDLPDHSDVSIEIFDVRGRLVLEHIWEEQRGPAELELPVSEIPDGMYLYQVKTRFGVLRGKLLKE